MEESGVRVPIQAVRETDVESFPFILPRYSCRRNSQRPMRRITCRSRNQNQTVLLFPNYRGVLSCDLVVAAAMDMRS